MANGRAYPDVSLLGHNYATVLNGETVYLDGTSASAPVFAAMVTQINDARLQRGSRPLGHLAPLLYSLHPSVYNDITSGTNQCPRCGGQCCQYGFQAHEG